MNAASRRRLHLAGVLVFVALLAVPVVDLSSLLVEACELHHQAKADLVALANERSRGLAAAELRSNEASTRTTRLLVFSSESWEGKVCEGLGPLYGDVQGSTDRFGLRASFRKERAPE